MQIIFIYVGFDLCPRARQIHILFQSKRLVRFFIAILPNGVMGIWATAGLTTPREIQTRELAVFGSTMNLYSVFSRYFSFDTLALFAVSVNRCKALNISIHNNSRFVGFFSEVT